MQCNKRTSPEYSMSGLELSNVIFTTEWRKTELVVTWVFYIHNHSFKEYYLQNCHHHLHVMSMKYRIHLLWDNKLLLLLKITCRTNCVSSSSRLWLWLNGSSLPVFTSFTFSIVFYFIIYYLSFIIGRRLSRLRLKLFLSQLFFYLIFNLVYSTSDQILFYLHGQKGLDGVDLCVVTGWKKDQSSSKGCKSLHRL